MRPPLNEMVIRTPELDEARFPKNRYPRLGHLQHPFGGTMGHGVRNRGHKNHAGWDLYANPGTMAFAIQDGKIVEANFMHGYGNTLLLEFLFRGKQHYALYAHLQRALMAPGAGNVKEGAR